MPTRIRQDKATSDEASSTASSSYTHTEQSPLLPSSRRPVSSWRGEFRWLFGNSFPVIGTYMLQNSFQMASIFVLGHLGPMELGAAALGSMFATVSAWSISYGTTTALDTLCSQAWTGARDKTLLGVFLQRALLILSVMFLGIAVLWWNATSLFLALHQESTLAHHSGLFLRYLLLGAPAYIGFEAIKKYLQAQGIMDASTYSLLIASPINLALNYVFVFVEPFSLGFVGAPLATSLSYWIMLGLLLLYIRYVRGAEEAWGGWSRESLRGWGPFLRLAIPGILMICSEWWAFELAALGSSYLGTVDLAAQSILTTCVATAYTIPFGIAVASANRVGNALGAQSPNKARRASMIALGFALIVGTLNSIFFFATRSWFGYLFTNDPDVVQSIARILPLCALFQIADGICSVGGGIIRGLGRQNIAAAINLVAYYCVALPVGLYLTFWADWGLSGLWTALSLALFVGALCEGLFILMVDWNAEMLKAQGRVKQEEDDLYDHREHNNGPIP